MNILIEKNLMVPVRDGVEMATDVYRPDTEGPVPTLVQRLPYNKELILLVNYAIDVPRGPGRLRRRDAGHARPVRLRWRVQPVLR